MKTSKYGFELIFILFAGMIALFAPVILKTKSLSYIIAPHAFLIVIGGTICAICISFSIKELLNAFCSLKSLFTVQRIVKQQIFIVGVYHLREHCVELVLEGAGICNRKGDGGVALRPHRLEERGIRLRQYDDRGNHGTAGRLRFGRFDRFCLFFAQSPRQSVLC